MNASGHPAPQGSANPQSENFAEVSGRPRDSGTSTVTAKAAVVAQELTALKSLKRLSLGASTTNDPDLAFEISSSLPKSEPQNRNSTEDAAPELPGDDVIVDASQLLWVPASVHPELAPKEWKSFVEEKLSEIRRASRGSAPEPSATQKLQRRKSRLSHQLTSDEIQSGGVSGGVSSGAANAPRSGSATGPATGMAGGYAEPPDSAPGADSHMSLSLLSMKMQELSDIESLASDPVVLARTLSQLSVRNDAALLVRSPSVTRAPSRSRSRSSGRGGVQGGVSGSSEPSRYSESGAESSGSRDTPIVLDEEEKSGTDASREDGKLADPIFNPQRKELRRNRFGVHRRGTGKMVAENEAEITYSRSTGPIEPQIVTQTTDYPLHSTGNAEIRAESPTLPPTDRTERTERHRRPTTTPHQPRPHSAASGNSYHSTIQLAAPSMLDGSMSSLSSIPMLDRGFDSLVPVIDPAAEAGSRKGKAGSGAGGSSGSGNGSGSGSGSGGGGAVSALKKKKWGKRIFGTDRKSESEAGPVSVHADLDMFDREVLESKPERHKAGKSPVSSGYSAGKPAQPALRHSRNRHEADSPPGSPVRLTGIPKSASSGSLGSAKSDKSEKSENSGSKEKDGLFARFSMRKKKKNKQKDEAGAPMPELPSVSMELAKAAKSSPSAALAALEASSGPSGVPSVVETADIPKSGAPPQRIRGPSQRLRGQPLRAQTATEPEVGSGVETAGYRVSASAPASISAGQYWTGAQEGVREKFSGDEETGEEFYDAVSDTEIPESRVEIVESVFANEADKRAQSKPYDVPRLPLDTLPPESLIGFPLPPMTRSVQIMYYHRFPVHVERAIYRLSHLKLANPKRSLQEQVLLSNFMYAYLNLVNYSLYEEQVLKEEAKERIMEEVNIAEQKIANQRIEMQMYSTGAVV